MSIFDHITERMPGGFFVYRADNVGEILYANEATVRIYGCSTYAEFLEYVHGSFHGMVHAEDYERIEESIQGQIAHDVSQNDYVVYRIRRKDGSIRWVEDFGHYEYVEDNGSLFYVFIYDITEKKMAEEEAKLAEQALGCEKRLNQAKNAFIFNLSHDIRTPMNAILGYAELVRKHLTEPEVASQHLGKVITAGHHLLALIDDLLELSELDAQNVRINFEQHNLAKVVEDAVDMYKPQMEKKKITVLVETESGQVNLLMDAPHFQRALSHLLSNAVKFTPENGKITVRIVAHKEISATGYSRFDVIVQDTGIGMTPDFLKRIFGAFEREKTSTCSGLQGTGIGLTVTKRIMDILGGSVFV
ncbi:MAG: PAS domain-containing sensor histidine kinase, partial [Desulfovibrio sp.]|nr:PAS domain-containing sensor histidine kinase [Desulfovibrio sp.]